MSDAKKFDASLTRFEKALGLVEKAIAEKQDAHAKIQVLETHTAKLQLDRQQMDRDLAAVRAKAAELVETSKQAAGKIDSAVSRIRAVLHSNSGG
jgi:chromosome segregation ATPase